ncbi:MAG: DUF2812 domain-containing protein [Defluviitaleaceae bacterium]|nr:DUF2812 domain-containing protein [Defluviitaleaceae bacterium]
MSYTLNLYTAGDMKNMEQYLSQKAATGKMLTKFGVFAAKFTQITPCEKQFFIDILPSASFFSNKENPVAAVHRERWSAAGWDFVAKKGKFYVFCADKDAPLPAYVSVADQTEKLSKFCLRHEILPIGFAFLSSIFSWMAIFAQEGNHVLLENSSILFVLSMLLATFASFLQMAFSITWCIRAKIAIKKESPAPKVSPLLSNIRNVAITISLVITLIFVLGAAFMTFIPQPTNIVAFNPNIHQAVKFKDIGIHETPTLEQTTLHSSLFVPTIFSHLERIESVNGSNWVRTAIYKANLTAVADILYNNSVRNLLLFGQNHNITTLHLNQAQPENTGILAYRNNDFILVLRQNNTIMRIDINVANIENANIEIADLQAIVDTIWIGWGLKDENLKMICLLTVCSIMLYDIIGSLG